MPIALSLSAQADTLWMAGPDGLFYHDSSDLTPVVQPEAELTCCLATDDVLLVGGAPHGVAYSVDAGATWNAGWMEGGAATMLCLTAAPHVAKSGVLLAGSKEDGVWRSHDMGRSWATCNVGLHEFEILCLTWAPPAPPTSWPAWDVVFAGAEQGLYRSPNGGLAWKKSEGVNDVVQCIAIAPDFHHSGTVLAGTEADGLWRSTDAGRSFQHVPGAPEQVNALTALAEGWLLSDDEGVRYSREGEQWRPLESTTPALAFAAAHSPEGVWAGGFSGLEWVKIAAI